MWCEGFPFPPSPLAPASVPSTETGTSQRGESAGRGPTEVATDEVLGHQTVETFINGVLQVASKQSCVEVLAALQAWPLNQE